MSEEIIQSPCVDICLMENDVCTGCGMTNEEVTKWSKMTNTEKKKVIDRLEKAKNSASA